MQQDNNLTCTYSNTNAQPVMTNKVQHFIAYNQTAIEYMLQKCDVDVNDFPMLTMLASLLTQNKDGQQDINKSITTHDANHSNKITNTTKKDEGQKNKITTNKLLDITEEQQSTNRPPARNGVHEQAQKRLTSNHVHHQLSGQSNNAKSKVSVQQAIKENNYGNECHANANYQIDISHYKQQNKVTKAQIKKPFTKNMSKYADRYLRSLYERRAESEDGKPQSLLQRRRKQQQQQQLQKQQKQQQRPQRLSNDNVNDSNTYIQDDNNNNNRNNNNSSSNRTHGRKSQLQAGNMLQQQEQQHEQIDISNVSAIAHDSLHKYSAKATNSKQMNVKGKDEQHAKGIRENAPLHVCYKTKDSHDVNDTTQHNTTLNFSSSSLSSPQPSQPQQQHSSSQSPSLFNHTHGRSHRSAIAHLLHLSTCHQKFINNFSRNVNIHDRSNSNSNNSVSSTSYDNKSNILSSNTRSASRNICHKNKIPHEHQPITLEEQNVRSHVSQPITSTITRRNNSSNVLKRFEYNVKNKAYNQAKIRGLPRTRIDGSLPTIYNKRVPQQLSLSPVPVHRCITDNANYHVNKVSSQVAQSQQPHRSKKTNQNNVMCAMQVGKVQRQTSASNARLKGNSKAFASGGQQKQQLFNPHVNCTSLQRPRSTSQTLSSNTSLMHAVPTNRNVKLTNNNNKNYNYNECKFTNDNVTNTNTKQPNLIIVGSTVRFAQCPSKIVKHSYN